MVAAPVSGETLRLAHAGEGSLDVLWGSLTLLTYAYAVPTPRHESPKPYLHPIRTLAGDVVTGFRPKDHVWHKGIQMTAPNLSGQNFWGGGSYVHGSGYVDLPNNGTMEHVEWEQLEEGDGGVRLVERLTWRTAEDEPWIDERRSVEVGAVDSDAGCYRVSFGFRLRSLAAHDLVFSSPAIEGRAEAGYGGLFWRGPDSFVDGRVMVAGGVEGSDAMGARAPWLAFTGRHENGRASTLVFVDDEASARHPIPWFVRGVPIACVSFAFAFSERLTLAPGEEVALLHHLVVATGELDRADVERLLAG